MYVTAYEISAGHLPVSYIIQVQSQIRTCKLQHPGLVPDTNMFDTASRFSVRYVHIGQHPGSVPDAYM
jgi:hypothetical protein